MDGWPKTMGPELRELFKSVTTGLLEGEAGKPAWSTMTISLSLKQQLQKIMESLVKYPRRPVQSWTYAGSMSITPLRTLQEAKALMKQNYMA